MEQGDKAIIVNSEEVKALELKNKELCFQIDDLKAKLAEPSNTYDEQSHFIYENQLLTTIDVLADRCAQLRKTVRAMVSSDD